MKMRIGYVSNSSSSSFLVDHDIGDLMPCLKLTRELADAVIENHADWEGNPLPFDKGTDLWLTEFIWDGEEDKLMEIHNNNGIQYMEGHGYDYEYEDDFVVLHDGMGSDYVLMASDLASFNAGEVPNPAKIRDEVMKIADLETLNDSEKLSAIRGLMGQI